MRIEYTTAEEIICSVYRPSVSPKLPDTMFVEYVGENLNLFGTTADPNPFPTLFGFEFEDRFSSAMMRHHKWGNQ